MNYREKIKTYKRVVIKIGTTSLTYSDGKINSKSIESLAEVISNIRSNGKEVVLVSSGAIAIGSDILGFKRPKDIIGKQVSSAVGQGFLMQIYENFFSKHNQKIAQILLTKDVFENDKRNENAQNTIKKLLEIGVIPIVNENDTVATEELNEFSDNDTLSAYVCNLVSADILIILSDIDGMYTKDPNKFEDAKIIHEVEEINPEIEFLAGGPSTNLGTGGMATKVSSAKLVNSNGSDLVIASGKDKDIIFKILNGEKVGTLFVGRKG